MTDNAPVMRAKMRVTAVEAGEGYERLRLAAVCRPGGYPPDGTDEDNTYARFTPQADLTMVVTNPALLGRLSAGQALYVDFTLAP
jgi:hypothetical protein